jgi:hypothetical protein
LQHVRAWGEKNMKREINASDKKIEGKITNPGNRGDRRI